MARRTAAIRCCVARTAPPAIRSEARLGGNVIAGAGGDSDARCFDEVYGAKYWPGARPFAMEISRKLFVARAVRWSDLRAYLRAAATGDPKRIRRAAQELIMRAFPWRPSFLWRGDPSIVLTKDMRQLVRVAALRDCLRSVGVPGFALPQLEA
jgi:hypothetical protein